MVVRAVVSSRSLLSVGRQPSGRPLSLLRLERYSARLPPALLVDARDELLRGGAGPHPAHGWLLGLQADDRRYPRCLKLAAAVRHFAELEEGPAGFELSFLKYARGCVPVTDEGPLHEGLHLDTHPALSGARELHRVLVNLSTRPRRFRYAVVDRWALSERGVAYGRRQFEPLTLPADIPQCDAHIPGRTADTFHALRFLASAMPHVGINDESEQFLVSFESVVDLDECVQATAVRPRGLR